MHFDLQAWQWRLFATTADRLRLEQFGSRSWMYAKVFKLLKSLQQTYFDRKCSSDPCYHFGFDAG